jgi:hypothetical protein
MTSGQVTPHVPVRCWEGDEEGVALRIDLDAHSGDPRVLRRRQSPPQHRDFKEERLSDR